MNHVVCVSSVQNLVEVLGVVEDEDPSNLDLPEVQIVGLQKQVIGIVSEHPHANPDQDDCHSIEQKQRDISP